LLTKYAQKLSRNLPSFLYKAGSQLYIDRDFPRHIFLEVTSNCNLSCEYCPREKIKENMDYELFRQIVDECTQYGPRSFSLHLFGEPLLYPRIMDAIRYIKQKNRRHTVLLTTNGTLLNKFAKSILATGCDRVIWTYRKNNFNDDSLGLLRKIGLIRLLVEETPKEEFEKWRTFPRVEIKHLHNYGGQIDTTKWGLESSNGDRYPCYHLWLAPAIRWNGGITICCNDSKGSEVIGTYGEDGCDLGGAWRSDRLRGIRDSHLKGQYKGLCAGCNVWKTYPDLFFGFQKKAGHS
jgi:MoaA/NifB/PqqE/SkfB family radical SAM enzyme